MSLILFALSSLHHCTSAPQCCPSRPVVGALRRLDTTWAELLSARSTSQLGTRFQVRRAPRFRLSRQAFSLDKLFRLTCSGRAGTAATRHTISLRCLHSWPAPPARRLRARNKKAAARATHAVTNRRSSRPSAAHVKRRRVKRSPSAAHRQSISRITPRQPTQRSLVPALTCTHRRCCRTGSLLCGPSDTGRARRKNPRRRFQTQPVLAEPVSPLPVDDAAVHTVAQQLARGGGALQFSRCPAPLLYGPAPGAAEGARTVRVMQFGDSHTAADMFTGEARARMQALFGDGGIGFSYAGHPFAGYRILGSGRGQSGGWTTLGTHFTQLGDAELGLGGVAIQSSRAGESVSLDAPASRCRCSTCGSPVAAAAADRQRRSRRDGITDSIPSSAADLATEATLAFSGSSEVECSRARATAAATGADAGAFATNRPVLLRHEAASTPAPHRSRRGTRGNPALQLCRHWDPPLHADGAG